MNKLFTKKRTRYIIVVLAIIAGFISRKVSITMEPQKQEVAKAADAFIQYRTIPLSDSSSEILAYEFHCHKGDYGTDYSCAAIIRHMNPEKDDYRTYSKLVVADIIRSLGTDEIAVTVYDSFEAYTLAEKTNTDFTGLVAHETDTVYKHIVATYDGSIHSYNDGDGKPFSYYTYADSKYTEQSVWQ